MQISGSASGNVLFALHDSFRQTRTAPTAKYAFTRLVDEDLSLVVERVFWASRAGRLVYREQSTKVPTAFASMVTIHPRPSIGEFRANVSDVAWPDEKFQVWWEA